MTTLIITLLFLTLALVGLIVALFAAAKILYHLAIDGLEIYTRICRARLDTDTNRFKALLALQEVKARQSQQNRLWQLQAKEEMKRNRQSLSILYLPVTGWQNTDIEIDDPQKRPW